MNLIKSLLKGLLLSGIALSSVTLIGCANQKLPTLATDAAASKSIDTTASSTEEGRYIKAKIQKVTDGDTMDIEFKESSGKVVTETIRLLLVDTPETKHPTKPVQPFGPEASQFAKDTLTNKDVKLELDVSERDKYGRLLVYLWVGDKMFNEMLLEKGLARVAYVYAPNVKYVDQFRKVQAKAQKTGVGIWSIDGYVNSDGFQESSEAASKAEQQPTKEEAEANSNACTDPKIKGNINSKGEKIYHVPGGQSYSQTSPEELFCTEEEAAAAGYRTAKR